MNTTARTLILGALILSTAIIGSGAAITAALVNQTAAVQQQDYHFCIITASMNVDSSDYSADTAKNIARQCRVVTYGSQDEQ